MTECRDASALRDLVWREISRSCRREISRPKQNRGGRSQMWTGLPVVYLMPRAMRRERMVEGFMPRSAAAPLGPAMMPEAR